VTPLVVPFSTGCAAIRDVAATIGPGREENAKRCGRAGAVDEASVKRSLRRPAVPVTGIGAILPG